MNHLIVIVPAGVAVAALSLIGYAYRKKKGQYDSDIRRRQ